VINRCLIKYLDDPLALFRVSPRYTRVFLPVSLCIYVCIIFVCVAFRAKTRRKLQRKVHVLQAVRRALREESARGNLNGGFDVKCFLPGRLFRVEHA
jgi:hypothetical protein